MKLKSKMWRGEWDSVEELEIFTNHDENLKNPMGQAQKDAQNMVMWLSLSFWDIFEILF